MNILDFNHPTAHPFNTFGRYEVERLMWWFLLQCIKAGDIDAVVSTSKNHDHLVSEGLLNKVGDKRYTLTVKSKGILYSAYGKEQ